MSVTSNTADLEGNRAGKGRKAADRSGLRWPSLGSEARGSHLKSQQQEKRFDAVETTIHKVPHEEVVGLRDVTTHLKGGRFCLALHCPLPTVVVVHVPVKLRPLSHKGPTHLTSGFLPQCHSPKSKLPFSIKGVCQSPPQPCHQSPFPVFPTLTLNSSLRS